MPRPRPLKTEEISDLGILASRREGNNIFYRLVDLCVKGLLEQGWCLMAEVSARSSVTGRANSCCGD
jgi:hypothetical protein